MTEKPTRPKGHGPMGYRTRYRLEGLNGEVIAEENNYLYEFVRQVEALGFGKVGETEQGWYIGNNYGNTPVPHPNPHRDPKPIFRGVEVPVRENFGRWVWVVQAPQGE